MASSNKPRKKLQIDIPYPHAFPLVVRRDPRKAREAAQEKSLSFQEIELVNMGFPHDFWLPFEYAKKWQSSSYPVNNSQEAIEQFRLYMLESQGVALVAGWANTDNSLEQQMAHDLGLLRRIPTERSTSPAAVMPAAQEHSSRVVLGGPGEAPIVCNKKKKKLTRVQYAVVKVLLDAGASGLSKDELEERSKHGDARRVLARLAKSDVDWGSVIHFPGKAWGGYSIH